MKVLVYGSNGWIGQQFIDLLTHHNINFIKGISRVNNLEEVKQELINAFPTHVISFIGRTHGTIDDKIYTTIDYLEEKGKLYENIRDNLYSPFMLSVICKEMNIHYTYLGTGCIFKYDEYHLCEENNGFSEKSEPNFFGSAYSIVKGFTDKLMRELFQQNTLNLRIRMPITDNRNSRYFIVGSCHFYSVSPSRRGCVAMSPSRRVGFIAKNLNLNHGAINCRHWEWNISKSAAIL